MRSGYHTWHTARVLLPEALVFASEHLDPWVEARWAHAREYGYPGLACSR